MNSSAKSGLLLTDAMKTYNVRVKRTAETDIDMLADFLFNTLSPEGAYRYLEIIGQEIQSLAVFADCFTTSHSKTIQAIHQGSRRMVSHNRKFVYVFHIEGALVMLDRVLFSKMVVD